MKKRSIISVLACGLMAAMLPGAAVAQNDAEGTMTQVGLATCDAGQFSPFSLPECEFDEATRIVTITLLSPDKMTGTFDGVQVREGVLELNVENGDFTFEGLALFSGNVEGCGAGTVHFEVSFEGNDVDGTATYTSNTMTAVGGGTLPVGGSLDMSGTEVPNDDEGTETLSYTGSYIC